MLSLASGDWHLRPDGLSAPVRDFLMQPANLHIGVGDLLDFTRTPYQKFIGSPVVDELKLLLNGRPFIYLPGNHDPRSLLEKVVPLEWLPVEDTLSVEGVLYTHGDKWGGWWALLKPFARWYPGLYRWLQTVRSTPGKFNPLDPPTFNRLALAVHAQALLNALNLGMPTVIGHAHLPAEYEIDGRVWLVDCGRPGKRLWAVAQNRRLKQQQF